MVYGIHQAAVQAVFDLYMSPNFLRGGVPPAGVDVETEFERAQYYAWEETYGDEELTWTDLRQFEMSAIDEIYYSRADAKELRAALQRGDELLLTGLSRLARVRELSILDDVYADLRNCAAKRVVLGERAGFFEDMLRIYASGGWPCGWVGPYPGAGKLLAFYPE